MARSLMIPSSVLAAALAATQLGATDCGEILRDPGFDLWCGDQLCAWKVVRGEVAQVPTWHEGDDGVELVGADTAIYQLAAVTSVDTTCVEFELLADVAAGVDVRFQVDVFGDGSVELDEAIPAADWQPLTYRFEITGAYQGIGFWITKRSAGHAVVAELAARSCGEGVTATATISGLPAPAGAACTTGDTCASGVCAVFPGDFAPLTACGHCVVGAPCPNPGDVCGLAAPTAYTLYAASACVPAAAKPLGDACGVGGECASGICAFGVCSACFGDSCGGGACDLGARVEILADSGFYYPAPLVCDPDAHAGGTGAPCADADDCASGACNGAARRVCPDGRACTGDADCPAGGLFASGLDHTKCVNVGVLGGTCQ